MIEKSTNGILCIQQNDTVVLPNHAFFVILVALTFYPSPQVTAPLCQRKI
jgi:hypothetical protein